MKVYLGADREDYVEVVAMLAKVKGASQTHKEKFIGLDFLNFTDDGKTVYYSVDKKVAFEFGVSDESTLIKYCNKFMGQNQETIKVVEFVKKGKKITTRGKEIENSYTTNGRKSRRYLLVMYKGKLVFTDVQRLNSLTKHYKNGRERNDRGLEWENYYNLITYGTPFR